MKTAPVWAWLDGSATPVRVGTLFRDEHTGAVFHTTLLPGRWQSCPGSGTTTAP